MMVRLGGALTYDEILELDSEKYNVIARAINEQDKRG